MSRCESHEIRLSGWLDGELDHREQLEAADHLVRCAACRRFWAEGRALDGLLAGIRPQEAGERRHEAPPTALWARIRADVSAAPSTVVVRRAVPAWAMRAAASLVLALGLSLALVGFGGGGPLEIETADVRLGAGRMDQTRFVSLTRELLEADPVYHEAMHRVLGQVLDDTGAVEASHEGFGPRIDVRGDDETTTNGRGPA